MTLSSWLHGSHRLRLFPGRGDLFFRLQEGVQADGAVLDRQVVAGRRYELRRAARSGLIAMVNQQSVPQGGTTVGFINPDLYAIGTGSGFATDFH